MQKTLSKIVFGLLSLFVFITTTQVHPNTESKEIKKLNVEQNGEYQIVVKMGEPYQSVYQKNPNYFFTSESGYGPGFMRLNMPTEEIRKVNVRLFNRRGETVLLWKDFNDVMFSEDGNYPELGVSFFSGDLPVLAYGAGTREDNLEYMQRILDRKSVDDLMKTESENLYRQYQSIIQMLRKYGWKPYIPPSAPRILGKTSWEVKDNYNNDGYYIDSFDKWQKYVGIEESPDIFVSFYKDELILSLSIGTAAPKIDIETNHSIYLYSYDMETRGKKWKEYLAADLPKWAEDRRKTEEELKKQGYSIEENYQDAPLPEEFIQFMKQTKK